MLVVVVDVVGHEAVELALVERDRGLRGLGAQQSASGHGGAGRGGSMPASLRICHMVEAPMWWPSLPVAHGQGRCGRAEQAAVGLGQRWPVDLAARTVNW